MNNTYLYTRMLAEDVQAVELKIEYNKSKKKQARPVRPLVNRKEVFAEAVYEKMQRDKARAAA